MKQNPATYTVEELISSPDELGKNFNPIVVKMKNRNNGEDWKVRDRVTYDQHNGVEFQIQAIEEDTFYLQPVQNDPDFVIEPKYFQKGSIFFTTETGR